MNQLNDSVRYGNSATTPGYLLNQTGPAPTPPQHSTVEGLTNDINSSNARLYDLLVRATNIADSYFGAMPQIAGEQPSGRPPVASKCDALANETREFATLLDRLSTQIDRLTCV